MSEGGRSGSLPPSTRCRNSTDGDRRVTTRTIPRYLEGFSAFTKETVWLEGRKEEPRGPYPGLPGNEPCGRAGGPWGSPQGAETQRTLKRNPMNLASENYVIKLVQSRADSGGSGPGTVPSGCPTTDLGAPTAPAQSPTEPSHTPQARLLQWQPGHLRSNLYLLQARPQGRQLPQVHPQGCPVVRWLPIRPLSGHN